MTQSSKINDGHPVLSWRVLVGYGVGDFAHSLAFTTNALFLMFFATEILHYSPAVVGTALLCCKLLDALTDPLMGELSDRTQHPMGRKRPYLLWGALPLGLSFFLLYAMPRVEGAIWQFAVMSVVGSFHFLCYTVCNIPYTSMTADLADEPKQRTQLTGVRYVFSILASIVSAVGTMQLVVAFAPSANPSSTEMAQGFRWTAALFGVLMVLSLWLTVWGTRERYRAQKRSPFAWSVWWRSYLRVFQNHPFRQLAIMYMFHTVAMTLLGTVILYFLKYNLMMPSSDDSSLVLGGMTIVALLCLYPWYKVSERWGKRNSYIVGSMWIAFAMIPLWWLQPGQKTSLLLQIVLIGIGFSSFNLFPNSMLPDVVEVEQAETGERREGTYYGMWVLLEKIARGFALFLSGWALQWAGFVSVKQGQTTQPPDVLVTIVWLLVWVPIAFLLLGNVFLYRFNLTAERHRELREAIRQQNDNS
ncbi:MAG: MFS transporter [Deltaproteobacteria bacterium]|nr:MAG: MFS transporter [Deltaproteobacteria bacterium]